jgi:transcription elongation factor Elf1
MPCPKCGHKTKQLISKLQKTKSFVCGGCGKTVIIEGDGLAALEELKKSILKFK